MPHVPVLCMGLTTATSSTNILRSHTHTLSRPQLVSVFLLWVEFLPYVYPRLLQCYSLHYILFHTSWRGILECGHGQRDAAEADHLSTPLHTVFSELLTPAQCVALLNSLKRRHSQSTSAILSVAAAFALAERRLYSTLAPGAWFPITLSRGAAAKTGPSRTTSRGAQDGQAPPEPVLTVGNPAWAHLLCKWVSGGRRAACGNATDKCAAAFPFMPVFFALRIPSLL